MAQITDGIMWIHESTLVKLADLARSTYQTWDSEDLVQRPDSGAFRKLHLVEALICKTARPELSLNATRNGMHRLRGDLLEQVVDRVRDPRKVAFLDLVVNKNESAFELCLSDREVAQAVRDPRGSRTCVITPLGQVFADAMRVFENEANRGAPPSVRKRGRPPKDKLASVIPLRGG
jgi:hypothetical protein